MRFKSTLFLSLLLMIIMAFVGCGGSSDDDGKTYTASGTYTYDSQTDILTVNTTSSDFECDGLEVGTEEFTVESITETKMVWLEKDGKTIWTRDSGTSGEIVGTWGDMDESEPYELIFELSGNFSLTGKNVKCDDDGDGD